MKKVKIKGNKYIFVNGELAKDKKTKIKMIVECSENVVITEKDKK